MNKTDSKPHIPRNEMEEVMKLVEEFCPSYEEILENFGSTVYPKIRLNDRPSEIAWHLGETRGELICEGEVYVSNFFPFSDNKNTPEKFFEKVFVYNKTESEKNLSAIQNASDRSKAMANYKKSHRMYAKFVKPSKFVLRAFSTDVGETVNVMLLVGDVEEVLKLISEEQGLPVNRVRSVLIKKQMIEDRKMMSLSVLQEVFDILRVDVSRIVVVPCPILIFSEQVAVQDVFAPIYTLNTDGSAIMCAAHAILYVFVRLACGIDWKTTIPNHTTLKNKMMEYFDECLQVAAETMISKFHADKLIELLQSLRRHSKDEMRCREDYFLTDHRFCDEVPIDKYHKICRDFNLTTFAFNVDLLPVWKVRMYLVIGWISSFYKDESVKYDDQKMVLLGIMFDKRIPKDERPGQLSFFQNVVDAWSKASDKKNQMTSRNTRRDVILNSATTPLVFNGGAENNAKKKKKSKSAKKKPAENVEEASSSSATQQYEESERKTSTESSQGLECSEIAEKEEKSLESCEEITAGKEANEENETPETAEFRTLVEPECPKETEEPQQPPGPDMPSKVLTRCNHWDEHLTYMKQLKKKQQTACENTAEAKRAKELAENRANRYETRARRTDEVEKELKQMNKEMEKLKKKDARIQEERKEEKERIEKLEVRERKRKDDEKGLREQLRSEKQANESLRSENVNLKKEAEKVEALETEKKELQKELKRVNKFLSNLETENNRLQREVDDNQMVSAVKVSQLDNELSLKKRTNNDLELVNSQHIARINELEERNKNLRVWMNSYGAGPSSDESMSVKEKLEELKEMRKNFPVKKEELKREMTAHNDQLQALNNDLNTLKIIGYEYTHFETTSKIFMETLNLNIDKINRTGSIAYLFPLKYPCISSESRMAYNAELRKKEQEGVPDADCAICYHVRKSDEEIQKCSECPKIFHKECMSKWFEQTVADRKCPFCRVQQGLDEKEYPKPK